MKKAVLAATAVAALQASAQTAPGDAQSAPAERTLRPVVVTPTPGVAQDAFDTPASVDVIDGATLRNAQLQVNLSESLVRVPGVVALHRQNYAQDLQISVRGFGARSTFGVRGIRLYADGIPATAPDGQGQISHFDLASADRIEVLRGPFSSLYGNSSGGVISIFTADGAPGMAVEAGVAFGSDGVRRQNARFSGEQGAWNWNLSATHFETDGYRDHSAAERNGFNGKARLNASADTRVTVVVNAVDMPDVQDPLGLKRQEYEENHRAASPQATRFNTRKSVDQLQGGIILDHQLNEAHAFRLTTWRGQRGTEQFQSIDPGLQVNNIRHPGGVIDLSRDYYGADARWTATSRLLGTPLAITAGLNAERLKEERRGFQNFTGAGATQVLGVKGQLRRDEENSVRSFDQYLHGVWTSERVSVTAGVRHSRVAFDSRDRFIVGTNGDDSGSVTYSDTTPALGVVFHATEALNLYVSAGRGFETPTFNELSYRPLGAPGLNFDLRSARSRQWELGAKAQLAPTWLVNAAFFEAKTEDEIVVFSNTGGRSTFQNAGQTGRRGFELATSAGLVGGWSGALVATWLSAKYSTPFLTCGGVGCAAANTPVAAGNRIPGIPAFSGFAELAWKHRPWGFETAAELRHVGKIYANDVNDEFAAKSTVLNLRASFETRRAPWTFRGFARIDNVTDRRYAGSVIVNEGNRRYYEPAPGRAWLVGANAAYAF